MMPRPAATFEYWKFDFPKEPTKKSSKKDGKSIFYDSWNNLNFFY